MILAFDITTELLFDTANLVIDILLHIVTRRDLGVTMLLMCYLDVTTMLHYLPILFHYRCVSEHYFVFSNGS